MTGRGGVAGERSQARVLLDPDDPAVDTNRRGGGGRVLLPLDLDASQPLPVPPMEQQLRLGQSRRPIAAIMKSSSRATGVIGIPRLPFHLYPLRSQSLTRDQST